MRRLVVLLFLLNSSLAIAQNIPVDYNTGRASVSIPIGTVDDRNLSHSINLTYNADAVGIDDRGSWVGQNWSLSAGGAVTRSLRGLPDDFVSTVPTETRRGWLFDSNSGTLTNAQHIGGYTFPADGTALNCTSEQVINTFITGFNHIVDTEPDIFTFSTGDFSGSFTFDNTGAITAISAFPYQELSIKALRSNATSPITSFQILTAAGVKYVFAAVESITRQANAAAPFYFPREYHAFKNSITYNTSWKLTSIETPVGERIGFSYASATEESTVAVELGVADANASTFSKVILYTFNDNVTRQTLQSIESPHQSVDFSSSASLHTTDRLRLNSISFMEITTHAAVFVQEFIFGYREVSSTVDTQSTEKRLFLEKAYIRDACENQQPYLFTYNATTFGSNSTVALPPPGSTEKDIWGYYKANTQGGFPKYYIYPSSTGINRISLYQRSGQPDEIVVSGANRLPSGTPTAGTLSKVVYPTGATVDLTYENHAFFNPIINAESTGGGLRIKTIKIHDGISFKNDIVKNYEYLTAASATSGKLISMPVFWRMASAYKDPATNAVTDYTAMTGLPLTEQWNRLLLRTEGNLNPDADGNSILYQRVTEKTGTAQGKTVFEFDIPFTYGASPSGDWNPGYSHIARNNTCPSVGLNTPGYHNQPLLPQTPYDFARGLITKSSYFEEGQANPVHETTYLYVDKTISPATVKGLNYEFIPHSVSGGSTQYYIMYGVYTLSTNKMKVLAKKVERVRNKVNTALYTETSTLFNYAATHSFPIMVKTFNGNGSQLITKYKYARDYGAPAAATSVKQVNMIDTLNLHGRYGTLIEKISSVVPSGGSEKTVEGTLYLFDNFGTAASIVPLPKETLSLSAGEGITGLSQSSFSGSGASRTFTKHSSYRTISQVRYRKRTIATFVADPMRSEGTQRQFESHHTDVSTGVTALKAINVEPHEIIFSSFDHDTDYDFDLIGFNTPDQEVSGKTGASGLKGFAQQTSTTKYLRKQIRKKPGSKYVFGAWYKSPVTAFTHSLKLTIKSTSNAVLQEYTLPYTVSSTTTWYYNELVADVSSLSNVDIIVEVTFSGNLRTSTEASSVDDVIFYPEGADFERFTFNAFGLTSYTAPDGRITYQQYDAKGRRVYTKDDEGNILEKLSYTSWAASASAASPISFEVPSPIYDGVPVNFRASLGCVDVESIQWKVEPTSSPGSGTYVVGTATQSLTFANAGTNNYVVYLKVSHPSYGSYEYSRQISVDLRPLDVVLCTEGATRRDLCSSHTAATFATCTGQTYTSTSSTQFNLTLSGCSPGATYTYQWQIDDGSGFDDIQYTTTPTITMLNSQSYTIRCYVTSSCGRTGLSNSQRVVVFQSTPGCPPYPEE